MAHASNYIDLTGLRFGSLIVTGCAGRNDSGNAIWRVRCDCGTEFTAIGSNLKRGLTRTCGCSRMGNQNARKKSRRDAAGAADGF